MGYIPSQFNSSLYILKHPTHRGAIWVHFDNGVVTGFNESILKQLEADLQDCLEIKWQEGVETIVSVKVTRNTAGFALQQKKLIKKLLNNHWDQKSCARSPLPSGFQSTTAEQVKGDGFTSTDYLSLVGTLSHLAVGTRPNISYDINYMARFSACPTPLQWKALRHIFNYVANTKDKCLQHVPQGN
jgi:hypothetical protein